MDKYANYLGILKWSLAQNDGTKPSDVKPMSEEDKAFFEKAVEQACVSDASKMKDCLEKLAKEDISEKETVAVLSVLEELLESLDNAVDFDTMKGYPVILNLLSSSISMEVKETCLSLLTTAAQNQVKVQKVLVEANVVQNLLALLSTTDMKLKAKVLGCLFSMISNYEAGEKVFLFNNGLSTMKGILFSETESNAVYRKVLVLLLQMARTETPYMRKFLSAELVNRLSSTFLRSEDVDVKETTLYFLQFILQMDRKCFDKTEVEEKLKEVLPSIQEYVKDDKVPSELKDCVKTIERYLAL